MHTQGQFPQGCAICTRKDTRQKDKQKKDIPGGGETRSCGKISLE